MKKLIISGLGLILVLLIAMPAVAEYYYRDYQRDLKRELQEYQRDRRQNARAMKRADSPHERKRIKRKMIADWQDYRHDVRRIKRVYHKQNHHRHKPVYEQSENRHVTYQLNDGLNYLAFDLWF